jgi:hypothetical protein
VCLFLGFIIDSILLDFKYFIEKTFHTEKLTCNFLKKMSQQQQQVPKELMAVAGFLKSSDLRQRQGILKGKRVDYFKGDLEGVCFWEAEAGR